MKSWLLCFLLFAGLSSCHKDDDVTSPTDLLYRTWQITEIQYTTGQPVSVPPTEPWSIVTFKTNGTILYGTDGKYYACCSPARFKRKGTTLDLTDVESIAFPERNPNDMCALVDCAPIDNAWQIDTLTDTKLVIKQSRATVVYKTYP
ncbi:hypothetical protein [Spirosoma sp. KNUC1025]|uniref:hypothetical protein n=1 Tax=Spirosoma sp. KNUC1025 TaxID=2894082 RepID=UPI00386FBF7F|nr:hypothetical protein LN737_11470 [Spirosoma sp. KNUC1025]